MKQQWQKHSANSGVASIPESINQSSYQKNSCKLGASRLHLNGFSSSVFFRAGKFAPKTSFQFISDLVFYSLLIATSSWLLLTCSEVRRANTENYEIVAKTVSEQFRYQLAHNPEFSAMLKAGAL